MGRKRQLMEWEEEKRGYQEVNMIKVQYVSENVMKPIIHYEHTLIKSQKKAKLEE